MGAVQPQGHPLTSAHSPYLSEPPTAEPHPFAPFAPTHACCHAQTFQPPAPQPASTHPPGHPGAALRGCGWAAAAAAISGKAPAAISPGSPAAARRLAAGRRGAACPGTPGGFTPLPPARGLAEEQRGKNFLPAAGGVPSEAAEGGSSPSAAPGALPAAPRHCRCGNLPAGCEGRRRRWRRALGAVV